MMNWTKVNIRNLITLCSLRSLSGGWLTQKGPHFFPLLLAVILSPFSHILQLSFSKKWANNDCWHLQTGTLALVMIGWWCVALPHLLFSSPPQRLLICNPSARMNAEDAMAHSYFADLSPSIRNVWPPSKPLPQGSFVSCQCVCMWVKLYLNSPELWRLNIGSA